MELKASRYAVVDRVATITLARPKRRNAWTGRMHTEYRWCLQKANADPAARVIVVTGDPEGNAFCAGADLGALEGHAEKGRYDPGTAEDIAKPGFGTDPNFDATFAYQFGLDKPVIAAINGAAAGVGLVLAAFADLRFAVAGAKFTTAHGRFNFPAEFGLSWALPRIVGLTHANDLLLSSRVFTAEEAFAMGVSAALEDPAGFLHRIFSARSLGLFGELAPEAISSYLSGQVIGTEVAHAIRDNPHDAEYAVLASPGIGGRYVKAIEIAGLKVRYGDPQAIVRGLAIIARKAGII